MACSLALTYSHLYNHHKYDNDERDVYSTAIASREFLRGHIRLSGLARIQCELNPRIRAGRKVELGLGSALGTAGYIAFVAVCWKIHSMFTLLTLVYYLLRGTSCSASNFVRHGFIDPDDLSNDFVNSTTVIEGLNFTLAEEYLLSTTSMRAHWTRHEAIFEACCGVQRMRRQPLQAKSWIHLWVHDHPGLCQACGALLRAVLAQGNVKC